VKRLVLILAASVACAAVLIALTFFYIAFSGHIKCCYDIYLDGHLFGSATVDKYVTQDKVVYKCGAEYPYTEYYPIENRKLILRKKTKMPLEYSEEASGVKGAKMSILLEQSEYETDLLYIKCPSFFMMKKFETGNKTMVFSPYDVMSYLSLMESYNYWKKGTQFFEVMIPVEEPMPVMRDKVEVRYLGDDHVLVMGRRIEAERFFVRSGGIPEAEISLSKYAHIPLKVDIKKEKLEFVITGFHREFERFFKKLTFDVSEGGTGVVRDRKELEEMDSGVAEKREYVYFESDKLMLSGRLWLPDGDGPFPGVLFVTEDGPMTNGERLLFESIARKLTDSGIAVLDIDDSGQGKSQGNFNDLDDTRRLKSIAAAFSVFEKHPLIDGDKITLMGHRGGGYLAVKASEMLPSVEACILLNMPLENIRSYLMRKMSKDGIQQDLDIRGLGRFDENYMLTVQKIMTSQMREVLDTKEDVVYFMGKKLSLKAYREYLDRKPYETLIRFERPLLMVFGKDDVDFQPQAVSGLKTILSDDNRLQIIVFRNLGRYMGNIEYIDGKWEFVPDEDVLQLIKSWLVKKNS